MNIIQFLDILASDEFQQKFSVSLCGREGKKIRYNSNGECFCPVTAVTKFSKGVHIPSYNADRAASVIGLMEVKVLLVMDAADSLFKKRGSKAIRIRMERIARAQVNNMLAVA